MTTADYIKALDSRYRTGQATEHTFRGDLQNLIESLAPGIQATNEPKRQACGAPDYILTKKNIPVGFIEAKDIGDSNLAGAKKNGNKEQFDRYKGSLDNLIFTDYLDFHYFKSGEFATSIKIGVLDCGKILPLPHNYPAFELLLQEFTTHLGQTIKSPKKLAEMMAGKAQMLANDIENSLNSDVENLENSSLKEFWNLVRLGGELRTLHLMESSNLSDYITEYPIGGDNEVEKPRFVEDNNLSKVSNFGKVGRVYINAEQYFDLVPELAWNFYIGGYQPAQKWLKDRKGRILEFEDTLHYQKIIKALAETEKIMGEIDGIEIV